MHIQNKMKCSFVHQVFFVMFAVFVVAVVVAVLFGWNWCALEKKLWLFLFQNKNYDEIYNLQITEWIIFHRYFFAFKNYYIICCFKCFFSLLFLHNLMKARKIYKKHHLSGLNGVSEIYGWNEILSKKKLFRFVSFRE